MGLGYAPTVEQVLAYYEGERGAVLRALARGARGRSVKMADWGGMEAPDEGVKAIDRPDLLVDQIRRRLLASMPDATPGDVPRRYPSLHGTIGRDVVLEVDRKASFRESFAEGRKILEFLNRFDAPFRVKFSGNCSSHFIVPEEAFRSLVPEDRWESDSRRFRAWAIDRCGADVDGSFTDDRHCLRLAYSLNERTGLVSVPIRPEEYDRFEPEWAEAPNVRVDEAWFETGGLIEKREGMRRMLREALGEAFAG